MSSLPFISNQKYPLENFPFTPDIEILPLFLILRMCVPVCVLILTLFICAVHHCVVHCPDVSANLSILLHYFVSCPLPLFSLITN